MASREHLRAVGDDEKALPKTPETILGALDGTSRDVMAAMRHALAKKLDNGEVSSNAIASAYKELRELDRLIRAEDLAAKAEQEAKSGHGGDRRSFNSSAI